MLNSVNQDSFSTLENLPINNRKKEENVRFNWDDLMFEKSIMEERKLLKELWDQGSMHIFKYNL